MASSTYFAIGLMSGTSLDGLDICYAQFTKNNDHWDFTILKADTISYSDFWYQKLKNAISLKPEDLLQLNSDYGFFLAQNVNAFILKNNIDIVDIIASHGHTIYHQPQKKYTLQIGDGRAIQLETDKNVVYDFRSQDVLLGGNGAPLVPIGDHFLFSNFEACVNLGGFSNISLIENQNRIAFDISPVNIVLNALASKLGKSMDENGDIAKSGQINESILNQLNALDFYHKKAPKSLGIEWVIEHISPLLVDDSTKNLIATFTEHIAAQLAKTLTSYNIQKALFTGGGVYNNFLIERLKAKTKAEIIIPRKEIIDYKEALIFAFMGVLRLNNEINVLASATGSTKNHCSGLLLPKLY